jgi:hypothetical protein
VAPEPPKSLFKPPEAFQGGRHHRAASAPSQKPRGNKKAGDQRTLRSLAEDIKKNGLEEPIVLFEDKILDGRNRHKACNLAGVDPNFTEFTGDDPVKFVISHNLHRRHLSESQRAIVADLLSKESAWGGDHKSDQSRNSHFDLLSQQESADLMHVNRELVIQARAVREAAESDPEFQELYDQVKSGERVVNPRNGSKRRATLNGVYSEIRRRQKHKDIENVAANSPKDVSGFFDVIVVDPPWDMKKIERDTEENQVAFEYPTMSNT